jgi:hypothetical protein
MVTANLRFLFKEEVDVLTCTVGNGYNAIAYRVGPEGERVQMLQASSLYASKVLEKLHEMSQKRVEGYFAEHTQMKQADLLSCEINLPSVQIAAVTVDQDMTLVKEEEAGKNVELIDF